MSMAKELFDIMQSKLKDLDDEENQFMDHIKKSRDHARGMMIAIKAVCEHTDGDTLVQSYDYHNNVDNSYYECNICGKHLRYA